MKPPKYPSTPHSRYSLKVHRDDTYHEDESVFVGEEVVITEKLDGGNTGLFRGDVYARSIESPSHDGWMSMVRKWHAYKTKNIDNMVFNGEDLYGIHSIKYGAIPENETFRLFSVRLLLENDKVHRCSWDTTESWARAHLEVPLVPVLFRGTFQKTEEIRDWFMDNLPLPSTLGGSREGFVLRLTAGFDDSEWSKYGLKFVRPNHVQTSAHWRKNWQSCPILPPR